MLTVARVLAVGKPGGSSFPLTIPQVEGVSTAARSQRAATGSSLGFTRTDSHGTFEFSVTTATQRLATTASAHTRLIG